MISTEGLQRGLQLNQRLSQLKVASKLKILDLWVFDHLNEERENVEGLELSIYDKWLRLVCSGFLSISENLWATYVHESQ